MLQFCTKCKMFLLILDLKSKSFSFVLRRKIANLRVWEDITSSPSPLLDPLAGRTRQWVAEMNAGKCDNYCYSEKQTQRAGEGGNYCSAVKEGKYMFPFLDLNIYPPGLAADSCSDRGSHGSGKAPHSPKWCLKVRSPLSPENMTAISTLMGSHANPPSLIQSHTHTKTHTCFLSAGHTHPASWSD